VAGFPATPNFIGVQMVGSFAELLELLRFCRQKQEPMSEGVWLAAIIGVGN